MKETQEKSEVESGEAPAHPEGAILEEAAEVVEAVIETTREVKPDIAPINVNSNVRSDAHYESIVLTEDKAHFQAVFEAKLRQLLSQRSELLKHITPLFVYVGEEDEGEENGSGEGERGEYLNRPIKRLFIKSPHSILNERSILIQELYELWSLGYRHKELPLLFIHYFASIEHDKWRGVLFEMLTYHELDKNERGLINHLYSDITLAVSSHDDFLAAYSGLDPLPSIDLSLEIISNDSLIERRRFEQWESRLRQLYGRSFDANLVRFFSAPLKKHASTFLFFKLMKTWPEIYPQEWSACIERQAFFYGKHEKLARLSFKPPEYKILLEKEYKKKYEGHIVEGLLHTLKNKQFGRLHLFYVKFLLGFRDVSETIIEAEYLNRLLANLHLKPDSPDYVAVPIRYMMYLYYIGKDDWNNLSFVYRRLGRFKNLMIPALYYARALFKRKDYEKAWNQINRLVQNNEKNLLLMNEAAVYAYHNGLFDQAEQIFLRLRETYPDNREVVHNESLYLQYKARHMQELEEEAS